MSEVEPGVQLEILDPGCRDPGYWPWFQSRVMEAARPHLAYRRRNQVTMESVMLSWSRLILPVTVAAAAVAAAVLVRESRLPESEDIAGVEEVLGFPADGEEPIPSFLHSDEAVDRDMILFAVERF